MVHQTIVPQNCCLMKESTQPSSTKDEATTGPEKRQNQHRQCRLQTKLSMLITNEDEANTTHNRWRSWQTKRPPTMSQAKAIATNKEWSHRHNCQQQTTTKPTPLRKEHRPWWMKQLENKAVIDDEQNQSHHHQLTMKPRLQFLTTDTNESNTAKAVV